MNCHQKFRTNFEHGLGLVSGLMWLNEVLVLLNIFGLIEVDKITIDFGLLYILRF